LLRLNYFLFENYDEDDVTPLIDPRRYMNQNTTEIVSHILSVQGVTVTGDALFNTFGKDKMNCLLLAGFLVKRNERIHIGFPIFLRKDTEILKNFCIGHA